MSYLYPRYMEEERHEEEYEECPMEEGYCSEELDSSIDEVLAEEEYRSCNIRRRVDELVTSTPSQAGSSGSSEIDVEMEESDVEQGGGNLIRHLHHIERWSSDPLSWPSKVSDYLPHYPHPMNRDFQMLLSRKREFAMLHSRMGETVSEGDLYYHQKFVRMYLSHYDRLFLVSEPGTGKTCSVVSFCEYVVRLKFLEVDNALSNIKRFIIVVRSTFHVYNIRQMIAKVCSADFYSRHCTERSRSRRGANRGQNLTKMAFRRMTQVGYDVLTYRGFTSLLESKYLKANPPNLAGLRKRFSETVPRIISAQHHYLLEFAGRPPYVVHVR